MLASITLLAAGAVEATHEAVKSGGLPQLDTHTYAPQLFWLALTFALLFFLLAKVVLPRIGDVISERAGRITRDLEAAQRLKGETDKALAEYEKALADARANATGIAKDTRSRLAAETEAKKADVEKKLAAKMQDAESRISATKSKALTAVNDIAADAASAIVARLIGQDVSLDEVKKALAPAPGE